ncbi:hypothetical protein ScPMuIL_010066 [Solemya velum]
MAAPIVTVCDSETSLACKLSDLVHKKAEEAISQRCVFRLGVTGGSMVKVLCEGLPKHTADWAKWKVFFCDERHVPYTDKECSYGDYKANLLTAVAIPENNLYPIQPDITVEEAAVEYEKKIKEEFAGSDLPRFDVLLLPMGADGHTCSLFPDHKLLNEKDKLVAALSDSPKPPPSRVTMTLPLVNNAACAVFVVYGASKAEMLKRVLEGNEANPLPAARIKPTNGELIWMVDAAAAKLLDRQ